MIYIYMCIIYIYRERDIYNCLTNLPWFTYTKNRETSFGTAVGNFMLVQKGRKRVFEVEDVESFGSSPWVLENMPSLGRNFQSWNATWMYSVDKSLTCQLTTETTSSFGYIVWFPLGRWCRELLDAGVDWKTVFFVPLVNWTAFWNTITETKENKWLTRADCWRLVYTQKLHSSMPIGSMYGIFTYIYHKTQPNVDKYTIHGSYGMDEEPFSVDFGF